MTRLFITSVISLLLPAVASTQVLTGIEVLASDGFGVLAGKRIGLITNPTGVDSTLRPTADILVEAPEVEVVAFFAPEHGIRGDILAGDKVASAVDPPTGLPVYSLYGKSKKPTPAMLKGIDLLVYDIQDNGCRSYTFISTLGKAMEAAAEAGIGFVVLDRPNPLGGDRIEGPLVDSDCISFVSQYPIPYIYGMTPGELALMLKGEGMIAGADKLELTVVGMEGWQRAMDFPLTRLPWVLPSPHIPSAETCTYYPASGIIGELGFLSIGVGYTLPFKTFAAPWIDGRELAARLNRRAIPGVEFRPISYTPFYGKFKSEPVGGVEVYITDPSRAMLMGIQFYVVDEIHRMYPSRDPFAGATEAALRMFDRVVGTKNLRREFVASGYDADALIPLLRRDVEKFAAQRVPYLLYH